MRRVQREGAGVPGEGEEKPAGDLPFAGGGKTRSSR